MSEVTGLQQKCRTLQCYSDPILKFQKSHGKRVEGGWGMTKIKL